MPETIDKGNVGEDINVLFSRPSMSTYDLVKNWPNRLQWLCDFWDSLPDDLIRERVALMERNRKPVRS